MKKLYFYLAFICFGFLVPLDVFGDVFPTRWNVSDSCTVEPPIRSNLTFVENKGQWEKEIFFKANLGVGTLFLEDTRLTFFFLDPAFVEGHGHEHTLSDEPIDCHAYHVNFVKPSKKRKYKATYKQTAYHNYFLGDDEARWVSDVGLFKEITYTNIFDGIDFRNYGKSGFVKYDFIVQPKADVNQIKLDYEGVEDIFIEKNKLHVITSINEIVEQEPYAYQIVNGQKVQVACQYVLKGNVLSFDFPQGYQEQYELIIDPTLVFASYSGATSDNWGFTATFDAYGFLYGAGASFDTGYPISTGAFQQVFGGGKTDIAISKFSPKGDKLIYTTYLGGDKADIPHSLIVNAAEQLIVFGTTSSENYPTTANTFDDSYNGGKSAKTSSQITFSNGSDIILTIFNKDGSKLVGSTYIGGSGNDGLNIITTDEMNYGDDSRGEVFLDNENNIYFGSVTTSPDFPVSSGSFSPSYHGGKDGCVVKMSFDLSSMLWGGYLGGAKDDAIFSLRIDDNQNLFVTGFTQSADFPTTFDGLHQNYLGGDSDGFVAKINPNGTQLLSSTFIGTAEADRAYFMDFDNEGSVFVAGQSDGGNYPITDGVYSNPSSGQFIHKLSNQLNLSMFSTVFGNGKGEKELSPSAFMIDQCQRIYFSGWGSSMAGMPLSDDALQSTTDGQDFYFIVFEKDATDIAYATFFGGATSNDHVDGGTSRFDKTGVIYQAVCAGCTGLNDFPTTPGAYSNTNNAQNCNLGVIKLDLEQPIIAANAIPSPSFSGCAPFEVKFENLSKGASSYLWDFDDNGSTSTATHPSYIFTEPGNYEIVLLAYGSGTCNTVDTAIINVAVLSDDDSHKTNIEVCKDLSIGLIPTFAIPGASYLWQDGTTAYSYGASSAGLYYVETTLANCVYLDSFIVSEIPFGGSTFEPLGFCPEETVILAANEDVVDYYEWNDGLNEASRVVNKSGDYWVRSFRNTCVHVDSFLVEEYKAFKKQESQIICEGDTLFWGGEFVTKDTIFSSYFSSIHGCDSIVQSQFVLSYPFSDTVQVVLCKGTPFELFTGAFTTNPGVYTKFNLTIDGCDSTNSTALDYFPTTEFLDIVEDEITVKLGYSDELHISTNSMADSLRWTPAIYLDCDSCLSVEVTPFHTTEYFVIAKDLFGCRMMDSVLVSVDLTRNVFVPNVFSPNNDGNNDLFRIFTDKGVERINVMRVFDRWGNLVYEGKNLLPNDTSEGWDGRYRGKNLDPAVFVYVAEVLFLNGDIEIFTGDITLIR